MKIIILGVGLVGKAIALDLAADKQFQVAAVDLRQEALEALKDRGLISAERMDVSHPAELKKAIKKFDLVINALPGHLGFKVLKTCLEAGKNVVDLTFGPEDPFELDGLARRKKIAAFVDCGVAPGLSNMLAGQAQTRMDRRKSLTIYVGGLPAVRTWPLEYKTVFSPSDLIDEYLRPARQKINGEPVITPALAALELIEFEDIGTLEAFATDGLRTMLKTLDFPTMQEKTLRYPGHREKIMMLRAAGFFDDEPVRVNNCQISPRNMTARILFDRLKLQPGERDMTVLRIVAEGEKNKRPLRIVYELIDHYDPDTGIHSMARTTGYTATMIARAFAQGLIRRKGIIPPEYLGFDPVCLQFILKGLEARKIKVREKIF